MTLRTVLAETFDLAPDGVERYLRRGDQVDKLNKAADAVEESPEFGKRDDHGRIVFRNAAYHYRHTSKAVEMTGA